MLRSIAGSVQGGFMFRNCLAVAALGGALALAGQSLAQPAAPAATPAAYPPNNYGDHDTWLCWPGRNDACAADLTTTVIHPDGKTTTEAFHADPKPPIDCFYVYPTVSRDPGAISDMTVKPEETNVVIQQAARLQAHCRLYAPMYRQFTLAGLTQAMMHPPAPGTAPPPRPMVGYNDVKDAWNYYLAHENKGRGVVLVGHSQGSGVLTQLIRNEIDGKPAQKLLVSAILMGTVLPVPDGKLVGGAFANIPLCQSPSQTGCAIAYSSFRQTSLPPPDNSRFGIVRGPNAAGMRATCVNPSALDTNLDGVGHAEAYFGAAIAAGADAPYPWLQGQKISTPFVSVPGMITAQCVQTGPYNVLAISVTPASAGSPRANDIPGDLVIFDKLQADWGLHLVDANLFMGNLVDDVDAEAKAWKKSH
jgi:hypothetical protein